MTGLILGMGCVFSPRSLGKMNPFWRAFSSWVFQLDSKLSAKKHPTNKQRKTQNQWDLRPPIMGPLTHTHYSHITPIRILLGVPETPYLLRGGVGDSPNFLNVPQSSQSESLLGFPKNTSLRLALAPLILLCQIPGAGRYVVLIRGSKNYPCFYGDSRNHGYSPY